MVASLGGFRAAVSTVFSFGAPFLVLYFLLELSWVIKHNLKDKYKHQLT